ncbi:MAG: flagellar basal-body rod protein FlgG [Defluviitaleaceae bacterium]|nr:flagellar basal-body rod protein FlgG [Defluviitaleaceae bacterium]MCL2239034.1 flagellar basal-body rod protein FlgG [Defluviitaleaceae bacterium]
MMRSLWTAASGMRSQMLQIDNISNNLANVNTTGFKRERVEFKSLLYETMRRADLDPVNMTGRPVNLQVGHGVRPAAVSRIFMQGPLQRTDNHTDIAIEGDGWFRVRGNFDEYFFTRDGSFKLMPDGDGGLILATSDGFPVMSTDGDIITIPEDIPSRDVSIDDFGTLRHVNELGEMVELGYQLSIYQFSNPQGMEAVGGNLFIETVASGPALSEAEGETARISRVIQGYLEMSNVQIAEEMVNLIVSQRAFDLNSRAITTTDEMLQTAINLKR